MWGGTGRGDNLEHTLLLQLPGQTNGALVLCGLWNAIMMNVVGVA